MQLTGKQKEKVSKAETKEQAKELIANAGMELTDDEMSMVSGGLDGLKNKYEEKYKNAKRQQHMQHLSVEQTRQQIADQHRALIDKSVIS